MAPDVGFSELWRELRSDALSVTTIDFLEFELDSCILTTKQWFLPNGSPYGHPYNPMLSVL